ncbi:MAG TPA: multicopper oxidase domain-containing protein [Candidatus Eremiobacteraceae bacterium]|nr:multicopper oxidase domain-containing protein [Candidatus Eremiobacteraceae bacterium]
MNIKIRSTYTAAALFLVIAMTALGVRGVHSMPAKADDAGLANIAANDNTVAGGRLEHSVLRIALVAQRGLWYPDGPGTMGLPIEAFGEAGKPLQIPGPFLRVMLGTRVVVTVRNELAHDLTIRGLAAPADKLTTVLHVPRGATRRVSFVLDRAGAFGYYGSDKGETVDNRMFEDAELSGAIVVDDPHAPRVDHIFVLGLYEPVKYKDGTGNFIYFLETINGRSYPATERLTYVRGQTVRWAVFNASSFVHPMHLHGFYYRLARPDAYDEVTHAFRPGDAEELSWTADRAGQWMFHCHIDDHITRHAPLADMRAAKPDPQLTVAKRFHLPNEPMGGMVIALDVLPRRGDRSPDPAETPRQLTLSLEAHEMSDAPYVGLEKGTVRLIEGDHTIESSGNLGPPIVLTRGNPVAISVINQTHEQTSVHWHGIALQDSYYDGGAGMGMVMDGARMSPPIDPGATFVARFTPPDAGTFMYHAHMDDGWQLASGLVGPLIVLRPGETFDPSVDHIVMISESYQKAGSPFLAIGGSLSPAPMAATAGVPQRLRLIGLSLGGDNLVVSLSDGTKLLQWTPIAKDGRDLPSRLQRRSAAIHALTIGETRDFRFTPVKPGVLTLGIYDADDNGQLIASQKIDVSAP